MRISEPLEGASPEYPSQRARCPSTTVLLLERIGCVRLPTDPPRARNRVLPVGRSLAGSIALTYGI